MPLFVKPNKFRFSANIPANTQHYENIEVSSHCRSTNTQRCSNFDTTTSKLERCSNADSTLNIKFNSQFGQSL